MLLTSDRVAGAKRVCARCECHDSASEPGVRTPLVLGGSQQPAVGGRAGVEGMLSWNKKRVNCGISLMHVNLFHDIGWGKGKTGTCLDP